MSSSKRLLLRVLLISACLIAPVALTACGGAGDSTVVVRTKRLVGKVYAKLIGDKIGQLRAEVKALTDSVYELSGTIELDGNLFDVKGLVDPENNFSLTFENTNGAGNGAIVVANGRYSGRLSEPLAATPDTLTVSNGGWAINLPQAGGPVGATTAYKGTSDPAAIMTATSSGAPSSSGSPLPAAGSCEWSATAFYNQQQVVSYLGNFYTALRPVASLGAAAAMLVNPATDTYDWARSSSGCAPVPFVKVTSAECKTGINADVITITGTAYGGGIGDALAAYTNLTDHDFSVENSFGLPNTSYSMKCTGGGFVGSFSSATSSPYSVCVKTIASNDATTWTSTQIVPHSSTLVRATTAYASKGNPLLAKLFNVGSIVMGFDAVRSDGEPITGNCPK